MRYVHVCMFLKGGMVLYHILLFSPSIISIFCKMTLIAKYYSIFFMYCNLVNQALLLDIEVVSNFCLIMHFAHVFAHLHNYVVRMHFWSRLCISRFLYLVSCFPPARGKMVLNDIFACNIYNISCS